ncbi:uncharacterized protein MONBRDRAFT_29066 [Monosiga brevicollis MX1]|uniref:Alpha-galactosidase n=1 Tax=Monosiga brevicollis TaxID=81824 RepID=A9VA08_MONBE|nr:uncharacterized protein MONBRDRAFT_29066 [Monosiga brevicollis MX1]EDQ85648.1 predicted protein [Monosiga brevicollis MX1]|eukprot:XP_001749597.1 hypothetical protein [Monosiga brevicollis MX1]
MRVHLGLAFGLVLLLVMSSRAYDNGAPFSKMPPLGWSSWVGLGPEGSPPEFDYCDEQSVKEAIDDFMSLGFYDHGYRHFHLDDCWAGGRNASGYLYPETDHFPNGLQPLVDYAHSKGLAFGVYTCAGTQTCVGNRPGSKDHWMQDAAYFASVGIDWVKMDWCNTDGMDPETTYSLMGAAMNFSGRPMHFNLCEWGKQDPWKWAGSIAQSWRATGDHVGTWESTKEIIGSIQEVVEAGYTGGPYAWNDMDMLETGNYNQSAHANHKEGNMTAIEYKTEFSMWAISASPLVVTTRIKSCTAQPVPSGTTCSIQLLEQISNAACHLNASFGCLSNGSMWTSDGCRGSFSCYHNNVTCNVDGDGTHVCSCQPQVCKPALTDLQREILFNDEVIAINQDVTPQGKTVHAGDDTVWSRKLSDNSVAVALYNSDDNDKSIGFQLKDIGFDSGVKVAVRDLWAHSDNGTITDAFDPVTVLPHQTIVLRLTEAK